MIFDGMPASLCAHSAKNGIRMPSATAAAKNKAHADPGPGRGARANVVGAENQGLWKFASRHAPYALAVAGARGRPSGALADVNAYGARGARGDGFTAK